MSGIFERTFETAASLLYSKNKKGKKRMNLSMRPSHKRHIFQDDYSNDRKLTTLNHRPLNGANQREKNSSEIAGNAFGLRLLPSDPDPKEESFEDQDIAYRRESSSAIVGSNWPVSAVSRTALFRITQTGI